MLSMIHEWCVMNVSIIICFHAIISNKIYRSIKMDKQNTKKKQIVFIYK